MIIFYNCTWQGSETPEAHFAYIWRNFIEKSNARTIVTVAHSQGGVVAVNAVSGLDIFIDNDEWTPKEGERFST